MTREVKSLTQRHTELLSLVGSTRPQLFLANYAYVAYLAVFS